MAEAREKRIADAISQAESQRAEAQRMLEGPDTWAKAHRPECFRRVRS
jgi:hypothetical protein